MKVSYQEMLDTPYDVILDDMEYLRLTTAMQQAKQARATGSNTPK